MIVRPSADDRVTRTPALPARTTGALKGRLRTALLAAAVISLGACAHWQPTDDASHGGDLLRNNLAVAEAALAAGQPAVAQRLYRTLSERFRDAPEPFLGLGHISFEAGDFAAAKRLFLGAAERAGADARAIKAEALLGGGRASLALGQTDAAREHFRDAREAGRGLPVATWAANGEAVAAALDGDHEAAEEKYREALRLSSPHPRIAANFVRMLLTAGKLESAAGAYARHDPSYWLDGDGVTLSRLIEDAQRLERNPVSQGISIAGFRHIMRSSPSSVETTGGERFRPPSAPIPLLRLGGTMSPRAAIPIALYTAAESDPGSKLPPSTAEPARSANKVPGSGPTVKLILGQSRRLHVPGEATSVLVASPGIADVQLLSPDAIYIIGKAVGRTSVAVLGDEGKVRSWTVSVVHDTEPIRQILEKEPQLQGVRVRRAARGIALIGEVASAALSERALRLVAGALPTDTPIENELQVTGAQQVNLEVQIAEVQRSVTEDLGINWDAFRVQGDGFLGFRIGRFLPTGAPTDPWLRSTIDGETSPGIVFNSTTENTRIAGMVDALAKAGLANVLARPNVTAVSGEAASFFSGGEYPLPTGFDDGVIVFEYKKYGILLDFVPTVIDTGRIVLKVRPEVSEPSLNQSVQVAGGVSVPVINVRRAETTVEVGDGESIVIAGLFRNASNTREAGLPGLKDISVLGALFRHRSVRSEELELIVIVTARLVTAGPPPGDAGAPLPPRVSGYHY